MYFLFVSSCRSGVPLFFRRAGEKIKVLKVIIFLNARRKNNGPPDRQEETHKKYIIHFTEIQFSPVLPSSAQFCPVFPSFPQFSSVLLSFSSNFIEFHPVSPSFAQFCPVFLNFYQFCPVLPGFSQVISVFRFCSDFFPFILSYILFMYLRFNASTARRFLIDLSGSIASRYQIFFLV